MAGAGKKTFVAGEVLTAAQVNDYLMDQAVMRFSGSAARAASITAPTEGMVTYLDDVNRLEYYDGSAWINVVPQDQIDGKIAASLFTASAQVLISAGSASVVALGGAAEGQVLTAASAFPGGVTWSTPSGAGAAIFKLLSATGTTALPAELTPGFYRISYGTATLSQTQLRFVDAQGNFYGASIAGGAGFATIPTTVASVNITTSAGSNLIVEELPGVTNTLPATPTVTDFGWQSMTGGSVAFTATPTPNRVGYFNPLTGSLVTSSVVTSPFSPVVFTASTQAFDSDASFNFVVQNADGLWSTTSIWSASAFDSTYPYAVFNSNGTYTPPSWSSSVDVAVVAGGGGGATNGFSGGGGAGGASLFTGIATPSTVSVTVGAGGAGAVASNVNGSNGSPSSFGTSASVIGGGGGGAPATSAVGSSGGSGGGGGGAPGGAGGAGTPGQGNNGGTGTGSGTNRAGCGGGHAAVGTADSGGAGSEFFGIFFAGGGGGAGGGRPGGIGGGGTGGSGGPGGLGATNTGGGGGGGGWPTGNGGAGGSGIVIVKALA